MAVPALHALKQSNPGASLTVMTIRHSVFRDLWKCNPDVDDVLFSSFDHNPRYGHPFFWLRDYWQIKRDIKAAVDTYGFTRVHFVTMFLIPAKLYAHLPFRQYREHKTFRIAREMGVSLEKNRYSLQYGDDDKLWASDFLKQHELDSDILVGLHFRGSSKNKSLPADARSTIMETLLSSGYQLVIFDSADQEVDVKEAARQGVVHYLSDHILHSAALIDKCRFLVCIDSGVGHVAAALNKKLFSIYFRRVWMENSLALGDFVMPYLYQGDVDDLSQHLHSFLSSSSQQ